MLISNDATAQGFAIVEAVLDGKEVAELARTLERSDLDRSRAGARHLMNHPAVSAAAADPRMVAIAERFLGETAIPYKATLFDKSPARNWLVAWHQDTALPLSERREIPEWGPSDTLHRSRRRRECSGSRTRRVASRVGGSSAADHIRSA